MEKRFGRKGRTQNCDEVVSGGGVGEGRGRRKRDVETLTVQPLGRCQHLWSNWISVRYSGSQTYIYRLREKQWNIENHFYTLGKGSLSTAYFRVSSRFLLSFSLKQCWVKAMQSSLQREGRESYSEICVQVKPVRFSRRYHSTPGQAFVSTRRLGNFVTSHRHISQGIMKMSGTLSRISCRKTI